MYRRLLSTFLALVGITTTAVACDVCGGTVNSIGVGLMSDYSKSILRLDYSQLRFKTQYLNDIEYSDRFHTVGLTCRYSIDKKWILTGQLNYVENSRQLDQSIRSESGVGDALILISHKSIDTKILDDNWGVYLETGLGMSLPTGKYNSELYDEQQLPTNFNAGTGAYGLIGQVSLVLSNSTSGVLLSQNIKNQFSSASGYRFGNQYVTTAMIYREYTALELKISPLVGGTYETIAFDKNDRNNKVPSTGPKALYGRLGVNVQYDVWQLGVRYDQPIKTNYSNGEVAAQGRVSLHMATFF